MLLQRQLLLLLAYMRCLTDVVYNIVNHIADSTWLITMLYVCTDAVIYGHIRSQFTLKFVQRVDEHVRATAQTQEAVNVSSRRL
jgi:hypothetical protein